jgi:hypothetical protein
VIVVISYADEGRAPSVEPTMPPGGNHSSFIRARWAATRIMLRADLGFASGLSATSRASSIRSGPRAPAPADRLGCQRFLIRSGG